MLSLAGSSRQTGCLGARGVLSLRGGSPCLRGGWARPRKECTDLRASHGRTVILKKPISALAAGLYRCVLSAAGKGETSTQSSSVWSRQHVADCG